MKKIIYMFMLIQSGYMMGQASETVVTPNGKKVTFFPYTSAAWYLDGNTTGGQKSIGTIDNYALPFITNSAERMRLTNAGNLGIGTTNPATKLEVNNGTTNGAVKIVDGTQGLGRVLTSDASGLATWKEQAVTTVDGSRPSAQVDFAAGNASNALSGYIDLPIGKWAVHLGLLYRAKMGESLKPNTCYMGRFGLSSSNTVDEQVGFSFVGSSLVLQTGSTGTKAPPLFPLFAAGVIRVNVTAPVRLYIWNMASSGSFGCGEGGSIGANSENYIYAVKIQ